MKNLLKATHDSTTGEKPRWWDILSWIVIPFARTQSKTIEEQIKAGVRMFDLRVKKIKGKYYSGHGLYTTKREFESIVKQINNVEDPVYATICYEGKLTTDQQITNFTDYVEYIRKKYPHIVWGDIIIKYTDDDFRIDWYTVQSAPKDFPKVDIKFIALNGKNWQTYLPIPWLWKKIYYNKPEFNSEVFTQVDFI